jgi:hypothetical protein
MDDAQKDTLLLVTFWYLNEIKVLGFYPWTGVQGREGALQ